jgi:integrase
MAKLTAAKLTGLLKRPGRHSDGSGLYFRVIGADKAYFVYRFRLRGVERELSLGPYPELTLPEARAKHAALRKRVVVDKVDVLAEKRAAPRRTGVTFGEIADDYFKSHRGSWRSAKHAAQWQQALTVAAAPLRSMPVAEIGTAEVLAVLKPLWQTTPETASRVRSRIEAVLDAARALGHIHEDKNNPARWRGHLDHLLPDPKKLGDRHHHAAMPWQDLPAFMEKLRADPGEAAVALQLIILCASRAGEVLRMTWDEVDPDNALWTIPGPRMKGGKTHEVTLSDAAMAILRERRLSTNCSQLVFPSPVPLRDPGVQVRKPLSNQSLMDTMDRLGAGDFTVHGLRSSFRDWAGENGIARELAEMALAHKVGDSSERAYARSNLLKRRRAVMVAWADFLGGQAVENVVALAKRA